MRKKYKPPERTPTHAGIFPHLPDRIEQEQHQNGEQDQEIDPGLLLNALEESRLEEGVPSLRARDGQD